MRAPAWQQRSCAAYGRQRNWQRYRLRSQMSSTAALALLLDPASRVTRSIRVTEGQLASQVYAEMVRRLGFTRSAVAAAAKNDEAIGLPAAAKGNPEGFLFPATYDFGPDQSAADVLAAMVQRGAQELEQAGVPSRSLRAIVIKASLIQAEARSASDMAKVSRVLFEPAGRRAPTAAGLHGQLRHREVRGDHHRGRPAIPLAVQHLPLHRPAGRPDREPGAQAITAALKPATGRWQYFVTVNPDTGETKFAVTEAQHLRNVREFQAWLRKQPG